MLVLGQEVGAELIDPRLPRDTRGGVGVVAREHHDMLKAQRAELCQRLGRARLERVLDADRALEHAIDRQVELREAVELLLDQRPHTVVDRDALVLDHKMLGADHAALVIERARNTMRHQVLDLGMALAVLEPGLGSRIDHGARHRVRKVLLKAGREAQHLRAVPTVKRKHIRHLRSGGSQGARLVEDDGVGRGEGLKMLGALDGEALARALAHGREHADGARELERAGVVDHERGTCAHQAARLEVDARGEQEVPWHEGVGHMLTAAERLGF